MDQLVVLQEIYASFSEGVDDLQEIKSKAIEGSCPEFTARLLEGRKAGKIDEEVCLKLSGCLDDVYEIKRLGDICRTAGMYGLAINSYNKALLNCRDPVLRPVLQNNLGQAYARQGDLARAVFYYQKSASSFEKAGDLTGLAHVLGNLGSAYRQNRDWDQAIEYCYRSLKTFEDKSDDLGTAQMTGSLGRIYADMGERDLANRYFERSLTDFKRLGDLKSAAWVLDRMGRIASERYDWESAHNYYRQSLSLFEEHGQRQSQGIVLANMGRMHLEKGDPSEACESLEKAIHLIGRHSRPGYQNALSCLSSTYSTLAQSSLNDAEDSEDLGRGSGRLQRQESSKHFARASDYLLELASSLPPGQADMADIKDRAEILRCRSYLVQISGYTSDDEAVSLAEKALASLDKASAGAEGASAVGPKKSQIRGLAKIVAGMKEARSIGLLGDEPWRLAGAISSACTQLLAGAKEAYSGSGNSSLILALGSFAASINAERSREDPAKMLQAAAEELRKAAGQFSVAEREPKERDARRLIEAASILESQLARDEDSGEELQSDQIGFGPERDAILLIAGAMIGNLLAGIDDNTAILTWDESLNLISGEKKTEFDLASGEDLEKRPEEDPGLGLDLDLDLNLDASSSLPHLEITPERSQARDLILADGTVEPSESYVSEIIYPEVNWLVPVCAATPCKNSDRVNIHPWKQAQFSGFGQFESFDPRDRPDDGTEKINEEIDAGLLEELNRHDYSPGKEEGHSNSLKDFGQKVRETASGLKYGSGREKAGLFSQEKAIVLIKALTVLVCLLLAVEAVLYLI